MDIKNKATEITHDLSVGKDSTQFHKGHRQERQKIKRASFYLNLLKCVGSLALLTTKGFEKSPMAQESPDFLVKLLTTTIIK